MAILDYQESKNSFTLNPGVDLDILARQTEGALFSDTGFTVIKQFINPDIANRIRDYYVNDNASAFRSERSPLFTFHGQSLILYYPRSPFQMPPFMLSLYEQLSLLRNRVYVNQKFYLDYCAGFGLNPQDYRAVYNHQIRHTWARVSWYKDGDGQCIHKDNYGEIAAFLMLTKKGEHWQKGGLYVHDKKGEPTIEVDSLCDIGDVLWLDQNKVIHSVQPVQGSQPGRLLFYIPIIPYGYMQPWYTFEGHPWELYFTRQVSWPGRLGAYVTNAFNNFTGRTKYHYTRKAYPHSTMSLPPANHPSQAAREPVGTR